MSLEFVLNFWYLASHNAWLIKVEFAIPLNQVPENHTYVAWHERFMWPSSQHTVIRYAGIIGAIPNRFSPATGARINVGVIVTSVAFVSVPDYDRVQPSRAPYLNIPPTRAPLRLRIIHSPQNKPPPPPKKRPAIPTFSDCHPWEEI